MYCLVYRGWRRLSIGRSSQSLDDLQHSATGFYRKATRAGPMNGPASLQTVPMWAIFGRIIRLYAQSMRSAVVKQFDKAL